MTDFQFTQLFLNYSRSPYTNPEIEKKNYPLQLANPFSNLEFYFEAFKYPWEIYSSVKAFKYYSSIKIEERKSFAIVELEAALLFQDNKFLYINKCLKILSDFRSKFANKRKTIYDNYDSILINSIEHLFLLISRRFPLHLDASSRDYYSFLTDIQEPIHAFKFLKRVDDKHFEKLFYDHIKAGGFISWKTKPHVFRSLFNGGRLEQKIEWVDHKNSLCYLIKQLNKYRVIKKHEDSHWKVVAEFFLLNGEPIRKEKLLNQPPPKDRTKRLHIENFVKQL